MRITFWPLVMLAVLPLTGYAQSPRWFEVEVIVFERTIDAAGVAEAWPNDVTIKDLDRLPDQIRQLEQLSAPEGPAPANLRPAQPKLTSIVKRLNQRAGYRVLFHESWQQAVEGPRRARSVRLRGGENFADRYDPNGQPRLDVPAPQPPTPTVAAPADEAPAPVDEAGIEAGTSAAVPEVAGPPPMWALDGRFRLWLQTYLFIDTELLLRRPEQRQIVAQQPTENEGRLVQQGVDAAKPVDDTNPDLPEVYPSAETLSQPWLVSYPLSQQRRLRSGEIHYFDHPLMGMLVQIRRLDGK